MSPKCMVYSVPYAGSAVKSCRTVLVSDPAFQVVLSHMGYWGLRWTMKYNLSEPQVFLLQRKVLRTNLCNKKHSVQDAHSHARLLAGKAGRVWREGFVSEILSCYMEETSMK
jgi:hypothetical protein